MYMTGYTHAAVPVNISAFLALVVDASRTAKITVEIMIVMNFCLFVCRLYNTMIGTNNRINTESVVTSLDKPWTWRGL